MECNHLVKQSYAINFQSWNNFITITRYQLENNAAFFTAMDWILPTEIEQTYCDLHFVLKQCIQVWLKHKTQPDEHEPYDNLYWVLKGELRSRFWLFKRKSKNISHRTVKIWCIKKKNRIENKEDMKILIFVIFNETFLEQLIWIYANERVDDVIASQFSTYFLLIFFGQFSFFAQTCKSTSPYQNISEQTLFCIYSEWM